MHTSIREWCSYFIVLGIDYLHPALGGGFGPGFKVTKGYDLVGNNYNGYTTPVPDSDPMDSCTAASGASGHGTHVSGIIAGYDAATVSKYMYFKWRQSID